MLFSENNRCGETCAITVFVIVGLHNSSCSVEITKDVLVELESSFQKGVRTSQDIMQNPFENRGDCASHGRHFLSLQKCCCSFPFGGLLLE